MYLWCPQKVHTYLNKPVVESTTVKKCEVKKFSEQDAVFEVALLKSFCVTKERVGENCFFVSFLVLPLK